MNELSEYILILQDECACIGCKMCVWCASGTFRIDQQHGRSRVFAQWVDEETKIEVILSHITSNGSLEKLIRMQHCLLQAAMFLGIIYTKVHGLKCTVHVLNLQARLPCAMHMPCPYAIKRML